MDTGDVPAWLQGVVLTPREAAGLEPLFPPPLQRLFCDASSQPPAVKMGTCLKTLVRFCNLPTSAASSTLHEMCLHLPLTLTQVRPDAEAHLTSIVYISFMNIFHCFLPRHLQPVW